jgi:cation-transporting ATPase E
VICLDKTGTITSGAMNVAGVDLLSADHDEQNVSKALAALAWAEPNPNATQSALQTAYPDQPGWTTTGSVAFSSARKWSSTSFDGEGTWIFGAPEMVMLGDSYESIADAVGTAADQGKRVLILAYCPDPPHEECLPEELVAVAMVMLEDEIRPDAEETLAFFAEQGVTLKVISGDNPRTVGAVGRRVGLAGAENLMDARDLPTHVSELADVLESTTVFGRVTPHQKRAMVQALQSRQHVVAMTGDGVNDVLALKDADCGIAMASGSEATRAVAQLVLLDSSFAALPRVLAEGRRVINNIERVASLFLVKTTYAMFFAVATVVGGVNFPFLPRHLTLVGTFTIGVPAFFLALAPNSDRVRLGFIGRVLRIAVPGGLLVSIGTFVAYLIARNQDGVSLEQERTTATLVLAASAVLVLARVARPLVAWKIGLIAMMAVFLGLTMVFEPLRDYFELVDPPRATLVMMAIVVVLIALLLPLVWKLCDRLIAAVEGRLGTRRAARTASTPV